jgi:hypothetical protein
MKQAYRLHAWRTVWCGLLALALAPGSARAASHAAFDSILSDVVHGERVDYAAVRRLHARRLSAYLDRMATVRTAQLERAGRLAFYINVYNATMISVVASADTDDWAASNDDFAIFDESVVRLAQGKVSLNHLEHEIIRKTFKDPRIHAALVCAAVSCPPLLPRAYRGDDLDAVLDERMRQFVRDTTRNRVDDAGRKLHLSSIFTWFVDDFGGQAGLRTYISKYLGRDVSTYDVAFLPYDWSLNATRGGRP